MGRFDPTNGVCRKQELAGDIPEVGADTGMKRGRTILQVDASKYEVGTTLVEKFICFAGALFIHI